MMAETSTERVWAWRILTVSAIVVGIPVGLFLMAGFYVLFDARLWLDACRVPGVTDADFDRLRQKADQAFTGVKNSSLSAMIAPLDAWLEKRSITATTESDKLALMDAAFRGIPMQYIRGEKGYVESWIDQCGTKCVEHEPYWVATYYFSWRSEFDITNYDVVEVRWKLKDEELSEFLSVEMGRNSSGLFKRVMKRARDSSAPLCPESAKDIPD